MFLKNKLFFQFVVRFKTEKHGRLYEIFACWEHSVSVAENNERAKCVREVARALNEKCFVFDQNWLDFVSAMQPLECKGIELPLASQLVFMDPKLAWKSHRKFCDFFALACSPWKPADSPEGALCRYTPKATWHWTILLIFRFSARSEYVFRGLLLYI